MALRVFLVIVITFVVLLCLLAKVNDSRNQRSCMENLKKQFGKRSMRQIPDAVYRNISFYASLHHSDFSMDDISWNDLDMDHIYRELNFCQCSAGDELLYDYLRHPDLSDDEAAQMEQMISFYRQNEDRRLNLQLILHRIGYSGKYSIWQYMSKLEELGNRSSFKIYLSYAMLLASVFLCFYKIHYGLILLFFVLIYNLITYFREKNVIEPYLVCFSYLFRVLKQLDALDNQHIAYFDAEMKELKEIQKRLNKMKRFSFLLTASGQTGGNPIDILLDYLKMFLHLDILKFNRVYEQAGKYKSEIDTMLHTVGRIDLYLSVLYYREYLDAYCIPEFCQDCYSSRNMYHPLLENPVKNDVTLNKSILITGSNASGKSTFLKTVAVNTVLAQGIHTVCADSYRADRFRVYTSLSLKDSIFSGDSYYMAEIKSIKRMMDEAERTDIASPVLIFVDEVLRGTNTIERIAASSVILQRISRFHGYCLAATHDIELTDILSGCYENMHFEEQVADGDIYFPYHLLPGKSETRNAIALLKMLEYDSSLVEMASGEAEEFEKSGCWKQLEV